ncbi:MULTISPECIES: hypothetical protein [unclassified Pseudomonas]|uniref:hypothetical protein n=1 Tax=unclassified Pseudomonas TaxID=196821 RepID=UPI000D974615|nr:MULTISPECIES: hypothetical protein [unclassified Pseudomonas]PYG79833.1 hypothetical protein N428_02158 [Pseudomonas sp. RV120224-01c]PYG83663.1 hypothetical protein N436_02014 [Pseudomonas sp. RV120224-01b]
MTVSDKVVNKTNALPQVGDVNNAANVIYDPNGPGQLNRSVQERLRDVVSVKDYVDGAGGGAEVIQAGLESATAVAIAKSADLYWPAGSEPLVTNQTIPGLHSVRHLGAGSIKAGSNIFNLQPSSTDVNRLYMAPGGKGDGLSPERPLNGFSGTIAALRNYMPLSGRWIVVGAAGIYNESVTLPDWLANGANYLSFEFPSVGGSQVEPSVYTAFLDGSGLSALSGFNTGQGNRVSITNLCMRNWYDPALSNVQQVRRALAVAAGSVVFVQNCGFYGNGLSNISALPGGSVTVSGGISDGARYGLDNTGGRMSLSATSSTYTIVRNALEYGLYSKHDSSTVFDYTEFRNNGRLPAAVAYGSALFGYKSNCSIDTRGCKFYQNNICWNLRGGFGADNPGIPDVYGVGGEANIRRYLCRAGGVDDLSQYRSNRWSDITLRFAGGSTSGVAEATILNGIATTRVGYVADQDQAIRMIITCRAQSADGLFTPTIRLISGEAVALGTYRVNAGAYGRIELFMRPTSSRSAFQLQFSCLGASQNLGQAVGQLVSGYIDLPNESLTFEVAGRSLSDSGTAVLNSCNVELSG